MLSTYHAATELSSSAYSRIRTQIGFITPRPTLLMPWPFIIFSKSRINKNVSGLPSLLNTCAGMFLLSLDTFKCTYIQATCRPMITVCLDMLPLMHDLINN